MIFNMTQYINHIPSEVSVSMPVWFVVILVIAVGAFFLMR